MATERPITDEDLAHFIDGRLDALRQMAVEEHLAAEPAVAARVMADLARRDALVATLGAPVPVPHRLRGAAAAIDHRFARRAMVDRLRRIAAAVALVAVGWTAHAVIWSPTVSVAAAPPPAFVDDAVAAWRAALDRPAGAPPATASLDGAALATGTGIDLPAFPDDWKLKEVQLFPASEGPSIEATIDAPAHGSLHLFAATSRRFDVIAPATAETEAGRTVYWQVGENVYALSGDLPAPVIAAEASRLAKSFN